MDGQFSILLIATLLTACGQKTISSVKFKSDILKIEQLAPNTFQHTTYMETETWGTVSCNGMIYIDHDEAIVFDTPPTDEASKELISWIGASKIKAVVVTHFHIDCLGGLRTFHNEGIASYSTKQTIKLAKKNLEPVLPRNTFQREEEFEIGEEIVLAKYFGEGHTKDNIIGYVEKEKTLFGGCLVKSLNAPKGFLGDADVMAWPRTIRKLKNEIPNLEIVIPGHGKSGGTELLDYTINLFTEK